MLVEQGGVKLSNNAVDYVKNLVIMHELVKRMKNS